MIGGDGKKEDLSYIEGGVDKRRCVRSCENSTVFTSLPLAVKWLRDTAQQNKSARLQVIAYFWYPISIYSLKKYGQVACQSKRFYKFDQIRIVKAQCTLNFESP